MSCWKYWLKTNLEQKKSDWAEFKKLRRRYQAATNIARNARAAIVHYCGVHEELKNGPACINYKIYVSDTDSDKMPEQHKRLCCYFLESDRAGVCASQGCQYAQKNSEYHKACDKQDEIQYALGSFWKNKFAHVK